MVHIEGYTLGDALGEYVQLTPRARRVLSRARSAAPGEGASPFGRTTTSAWPLFAPCMRELKEIVLAFTPMHATARARPCRCRCRLRARVVR